METANDQGRIVSWNKAAKKIFGYPPGKMIGQPLEQIVTEKFREVHN